MVACAMFTFVVGSCTSGLLIWWRFEQRFRQQQEHNDKLRRQVQVLQAAQRTQPPSSGGLQDVFVGDSDYKENFCSELWRLRFTTSTSTSTSVTTSSTRTLTKTTTTTTTTTDACLGSCTRSCKLERRQDHQARKQASRKRWAYVMLSHNAPGNPEHLWGVIAVANALQRLRSAYPLVLLTNTTHFPDDTPVATALKSLNVQIRPVYKVEMPKKHKKKLMYQHWRIAYWKLQIWNLVEYEKLIWLDSDTILYRSIDWLFDRPWMWAQRDDWFCRLNVSKVCSGIVLLYPNASDYHGLLNYAEHMGDLTDGDQQLISSYFAKKRNRTINLLSDLEASFGQCIGKARTPYLNPDGSPVWGVWNVPSFVHKSGGWGDTNENLYSNVCFMPNMSMQLYVVGDATLNVCQYHPLGAYWRSLFCDAVARLGIRFQEVNAFCDDECWYRGRPQSAPSRPGLQVDTLAGQAMDWRLCGVVNATLSYADYYGRRKGLPTTEEKKKRRRRH